TPEGSGRARLAASPPTHHPPLRDLPPSLPLRGTKERLCPPRSGGRGPREAGERATAEGAGRARLAARLLTTHHAGTFPLRCRSGGQRKGFVPHEVGEGAPAKRGKGRPRRGRVERALQPAYSPPTTQGPSPFAAAQGDKGKALSPTKWGKGPPRSGVGGDPRRGRVERALQQARLLTTHHSGPPTSDLRLSAAGGFEVPPYLPPPQATPPGTFP